MPPPTKPPAQPLDLESGQPMDRTHRSRFGDSFGDSSEGPVQRSPRLFQGRLMKKRLLAASTWHLSLETPSEFQYDSGQFIIVQHLVDGQTFRLPYSIASAAQVGRLELCVRCMDEGPLAGFPCSLEEGAGIRFEGPHGLFVPRYPGRDALFVAHGTGIGPIRSILRDLIARPHDGRLTLLFGARNQASILYRDEWEELEKAEPRFRFLPTLSQPEGDWPGLRGYVQQHLPAFFDQPDLAVYMCGSPEMVSEVRAQFTSAGFDGHQLIYERYGE